MTAVAIQNLFLTTFGSQWGLVSMALTYDDVSLQVQGLVYSNPSPSVGALTLAGPLNRVITTPANDARTVDLTSSNIVCVQTQVTDRFGTRTETALPGGETAQFVWPSP